jgi:hypothetical protein
MIQSETAYKEALKQLKNDAKFMKEEKTHLKDKGYSEEEIERAMKPLLSFHAQLKEEIEAYEQSNIK